MTVFELFLGDITKFQADAIVNAANTSLLDGGGVTGAIHKAAGPRLLETCKRFGGCATGEARITPAFDIRSADYIIHTPGPIFSAQQALQCDRQLAQCYRNSIKLAEQHYCKTLAFPSISTGIFHFPLNRAANVVADVFMEIRGVSKLEHITMCCFDTATLNAYAAVFRSYGLIRS